MAAVNGPDTDQDQDERIAAAAMDRLLGGAAGLALVGAQARIDRIIPRLHGRLDQRRLLPVVFPADHGTPESLRAAVEQAHADRSGPETEMLLIVPDAGRLSADLLRELDVAAHAAAEFGGLKFMLASTGPLRRLLREGGLASLHDVLGADLVVPSSDARTQVPRSAPAAIRPRRSIHPVQRIVLAAGILAAFILVVALVLAAIRPGRPTIPVAAPPAMVVPPPAPRMVPVLPAQPVQPPVRATPPRTMPSQAAPSQPAPSQAVPAQPAPIPPAPMPPPVVAPPVVTPPASASLLLMAQPGDTLPVLYARVYAGSNPPPFAEVQTLNPIVRPGTRLVFPPPPGGWPSKP